MAAEGWSKEGTSADALSPQLCTKPQPPFPPFCESGSTTLSPIFLGRHLGLLPTCFPPCSPSPCFPSPPHLSARGSLSSPTHCPWCCQSRWRKQWLWRTVVRSRGGVETAGHPQSLTGHCHPARSSRKGVSFSA